MSYSTAAGKKGMARAAIMTDMQPNCFTVSGGQYNATLFHGSRNIRSAAFDDERNQMRLNTTTFRFRYAPAYTAFKSKIKSIYHV